MSGEKEFKPSKRQLDLARREGRIAKSSLLTQAAVLGACLVGLFLAVAFSWVATRMMLECCWTEGFEDPLFCFRSLGRGIVIGVMAGLGPAVVAAVVAEGLQVGISFELGPLKPKLERLNLAHGARRILGSLSESWFLCLKFVVLGGVLVWFCRRVVPEVPEVLLSPSEGGLAFLQASAFMSARWAVAALLLLSLVDYWIQNRKFRGQVWMSVDEMRREQREDEGDPLVKAMRRGMRQSFVMQDLARGVKRSKVIIVERS